LALFHFSWFLKILRRSSAVVRGPRVPEISVRYIWMLCTNSRKKDIWSSRILWGHFFISWYQKNTIFSNKFWKIWVDRNFWRSLEYFFESPRIQNFFSSINWLSACICLIILKIHHIFTKDSFFGFGVLKNTIFFVIFVTKQQCCFCCCFRNNSVVFSSWGATMDTQEVPKKKTNGLLQYSWSYDPICI